MKIIFTILSLCLLPMFLASCSSKIVNIDERTQNKPNDVIEDNNNGTNPKLFANEQYLRTPQDSDIGSCRVTFHMTKSQVVNDSQLANADEISSKSTYDQCLDHAGDKLYSSNNVFAKVHFDRSDGTSVDTVISRH